LLLIQEYVSDLTYAKFEAMQGTICSLALRCGSVLESRSVLVWSCSQITWIRPRDLCIESVFSFVQQFASQEISR